LRPTEEREALWQLVAEGKITTIGSDHSPSPPGMKTDANFFKVWGGISGGQHTLPLLLSEGHVNRGVALPLLVRLVSFNVAKRFNLPSRKGEIKAGCDADLALVKLDETSTISAEDLFYRHRQSPYVGRALRGRVRQTLLRGRTIFKDGKITAKLLGELVTGGNHGHANDD
jgi:allantoinase